jgi:hypothetical protein
MKAIGMGLIVYGHVAHATTVALTPPIYLKQIGVALFLFSTGFTLAREQRPTAEVLFNRLFQMWLFGLPLAAIIATIGIVTRSGLALSNFLPFLGGANVVFDHFPANPTTWYLGTYFHLLVVWALVLRRFRIRRSMVALALVAEIPVRAALVSFAGPFVAYMLLTNWTAVFLLGMARGSEDASRATGSPLPYAVALVAGVNIWALAMRGLLFNTTFPFMTLGGWPRPLGLVAVSAAVTFLYVSAAALVFEATRRVAAPAPVQFIARNTPIIFLAHMPVFFALNPMLVAAHLGFATRVIVQLIVCLGGLSVASEGIRGVVRPDRLRARMFEALTNRFSLAGSAGARSAESVS